MQPATRLLQLKSDFRDYYDVWFDRVLDQPVGDIFYRLSTGGMNRKDMLEYMIRHGLKTPRFGSVAELQDTKKVVVYTDLNAHCGEGKELLSTQEALDKYPNNLATEYIEYQRGLSYRYLQVGSRHFWITYTSTEDWRSNVGDGDCVLKEGDQPTVMDGIQFPYALYAIDFVPDEKQLYAVDFNTAPGIRGSGVEKVLNGHDAFQLIKEAHFVLKTS